MLERFGLDTTQFVGVLSFVAAAIACAAGALRSPASEARTWIVLACFSAAFAIEVVAMLRLQLHDFVGQMLRAQGLYQGRTPPQQIIIATTAAIFLIGTFFVLRRTFSQSWPARIASATATAFVALFAIEGVSLHAIDAIFWSSYYQVKVIGWLWAAGATIITVSAIWRAARAAPHTPYARYR
jgi:hypothetical protein